MRERNFRPTIFDKRISRRGFLAGGLVTLAGLVAARCTGGETEPEATQTPKPTETLASTPVPAPTPEATPAPTPAPTLEPTSTPTPERPQFTFEAYGVYVGDSNIGGRVLIATLPSGTLIFRSENPGPRCTHDYYKHYFTSSGSWSPESQNFSLTGLGVAPNKVTGTLSDATTISGEIVSERHEAGSPSGQVVCEPGTLSYTAKLVGNGKDFLLEAYKNIFIPPAGFPPGTSRETIQAALERSCRCRLP